MLLMVPQQATGNATADCYEVIVTDDDPGMSAKPLLDERYPWAKWVAGPRRGPAANRNNGAAQARADWLVFVDDDVLPDADLLRAYAVEIQQQPETKVFEGRVYVDRKRRSLAECSPTNETGGYLWSCNFAIRRDLFYSLRGFNESFPYSCLEDVEFRLRLANHSHRFVFVPDAAVCHPWRLRAPRKEAVRYRESAAVLATLHPQMARKTGVSAMSMMAAREFVKEILPGVFRYRGAGLGGTLVYHFLMILFAAVPSLVGNPPMRSSGSFLSPAS
jgi:GT2 family glycosyltransferase